MKCDIVIIGNGILGCATALELSWRDSNLRIAVIGPAKRPGGATVAAGAMLGCFAEVNHRTLSSAAGRAKLEVSLRALEMWPAWLDELNNELSPAGRLTIRDGTFVVLNSRGGRLDSLNYQAIVDAAGQYERILEPVAFGEVPNLSPAADARPLAALYLPDEGAIDARRLLDAVVRVAERNGVSFIDDTVVGWKQDHNRATGALTESGEEIQADRFLVAAGAASHRVVRELADEDGAPLPPMFAGKGIALTSRGTGSGIEHVVRTPNRAGGCGLHLVPSADGTVYLGATNDLMLRVDDSCTIGMVNFLLGCAVEQLDKRLFRSEIIQWHVGNRPGTIDGFPLVGRIWQDNVWMLSGTYRDGFHCSPLLARHTADSLLDGTGILGDHCFAPLRRPLKTMSRDDALEELSLHLVSMFYEYSGHPPAYLQPSDVLGPQSRGRTEETYDRLEIDFGLAPEILGLLNYGRDREANISYFRHYFKRALDGADSVA